MFKRIIKFTLVVLIAFVLVFFNHQYFTKGILPYSLLNMYLFHAISAIIVYISIEAIAVKLPSQASYTYLAAIFLKIGVFVLMFQSSVFGDVVLSKFERLSLIVPLFLFLIIEAVGISKLLSSK